MGGANNKSAGRIYLQPRLSLLSVSSVCSLRLDALEESLQVSSLVVEEFNFVGAFLLLTLTSLVVSLSDGLDLALQLNDLV